MIRILDTGDLHIGRKYTNQEEQIAEKYSKARIDALHNVLRTAEEQECDYIVVAGDLFDTKYVSTELIRRVCEMLGESVCPVIVLPGNHDFYEGSNDKLWSRFLEYSSENTTLLKENVPVVRGDIVFYPCVCNDKHSESNMLGWLKEDQNRESGFLHVGLAHGAVEGFAYDKEKKYYNMTKEELEQCHMDLWIIGHAHVPFPEGCRITGERIYNAGTHQQTDISDYSEGSVFVIEIDDKKNITAKRILTGVLHFCRLDMVLRHGQSLEEELHRLTDELSGSSTSLRVQLTGIALAEDYEARKDIYAGFEEKFVKFEVQDGGLQREITGEMIDAETVKDSVENRLLNMYVNEPEILNIAYDLIRQCREEK